MRWAGRSVQRCVSDEKRLNPCAPGARGALCSLAPNVAIFGTPEQWDRSLMLEPLGVG